MKSCQCQFTISNWSRSDCYPEKSSQKLYAELKRRKELGEKVLADIVKDTPLLPLTGPNQTILDISLYFQN